MVTKPGSAGDGEANFCGESALENYAGRRKQGSATRRVLGLGTDKHRVHPLPAKEIGALVSHLTDVYFVYRVEQ